MPGARSGYWSDQMTKSNAGRLFLCVLFAGLAMRAGAAAGVPALFVASDSTAANYTPRENRQQGWAAVLQPLFDEHRLRVVNAAKGGRSSRTFVTEGLWDQMLADVRAGDFVIIQFGHNDAGAVNAEPPGSTRPLRARGSIPGVGNESEEIDNVVTGKHETVYTFGWYLRKMIADTRSKGATPILMSTTKSNNWEEGRPQCPSRTYRLWTWQTAVAEKVPFVDLTRITADRYLRQGQPAVTAQFIDDTVHTNIDGAEANAADVVAGLRALRELKFDSRLSKAGRKIRADAGL